MILLVFLGVSLGFSKDAFAESPDRIILSEKDSKLIFNQIQLELTQKGILDFPFLSPEEQVGIFLARDALRKSFLNFLPGFISTETIKIVVKFATEIKNLPAESVGDLIGRFENLTVKEAAKVGLDWLSQNEIMISSGEITGSYDSYWGNKFSVRFQYLITYKPIKDNWGDLIFEFYSADSIDPPAKSTVEFPWESSDWLRKNKKTLDPFVVHVKTRVQKSGLGWIVDSNSTQVVVTFPEKVPKLDLSPELPYPLQEQKISLLNQWIVIKRLAATFGLAQNATWQKIQQAGDKIYTAAKEIQSLYLLVKKFIPQDVGSGVVLKQDLATSPVLPSNNKTEKKTAERRPKDALKETAKDVGKDSSSISYKNPLEAPSEKTSRETVNNSQGENQNQGHGQNPMHAEISCATAFDTAPQHNAVILNEIAWAGTPASPNNEYIELKNISSTEVAMAGWQIVDRGEKIRVVFGATHKIPSQGLLLLERTDDSSVPGVAADLIYTNAIGNMKEELYLFDESCAMRDKVVANPKWPAGDSALRKSMERGYDLTWHTYNGLADNYIFGTPKAENSAAMASISNAVSVSAGGGEGGGSAPQKTYQKILISEIQTDGASAKDEFVELFNPNAAELDLAGWTLKKKTSSGSESNLVSASAFSGRIPALGYFLIAPQKEDDGTPNYKGQAPPDLYYSGKTYSIAANNAILLYNPNSELVDKVGFGSASDFEKSPAQNPAAGSSIARKIAGGVLQDTDDNSQDFVQGTATPRMMNKMYVENSLPSLAQNSDTTPPQVVFDSLAPLQTDTLFTLSWSGSDPVGSVSPSGIDAFYLQYSVTPAADGVFLKYENNGAVQSWQQGAAGEITLSSSINGVSVTAQDGVGYLFSLKAKDVAGNQSTAANVSTEVALAKTVVVNEIAWAGAKSSANDEWIELFNNGDSPVNFADWKLKADDGTPNISLVGSIGAKSYYLLERTNDTTISDTAADQIYTGALGNEGESLKLYDVQDTLIDVVDASAGWFAGNNTTKQSMERIDSTKSGSDAKNWASNNLVRHNGKDAGGNFINGTPKQQNSVSAAGEQITDLRFSEFGNALTLPLLGSPYLTYGITVPENAALTVEPGVTIKFRNNYAQFIVDGTLKAAGSSEKKITFTTDSNSGGPWCGLSFSSKSKNSDLEYVTIDQSSRSTCSGVPTVHYAMMVDGSDITLKNSSITGGNGVRKLYLKGSNSMIDAITISGATFDQNSSAITIDGGSPTIQNSTFSNNSIGIYSVSPVGQPNIKNNTFTANTYPIRISSSSPLFSGNVATQNAYNGIYTEGAVFYTDVIWQADFPYIVESFTVNAGKKLTLQPGVVVKFADLSHGNREIIVNGTLLAQGTAEKPVTFSVDDSVPNWRRIYFALESAGSILQNVVLNYGGSNLNEGALYIESNDVRIQNASITLQSNAYAFRVSGTCPIISGVTIAGGAGVFSPASISCSF